MEPALARARLRQYSTLVFDCDGVLLDSNRVKSDAFYYIAKPYGEEAARRLVGFHKAAGSIGRQARIEYFIYTILGREPEPGEIDRLMLECRRHVMRGTLLAPKMPGLLSFLQTLEHQSVVVSGIEQTELEEILEAHNLAGYFECVLGGRKGDLLRSLDVARPALYLGDTEDDYHCAREAGMDFLWVSGAAEVQPPRDHPMRRMVIKDFTDLLL